MTAENFSIYVFLGCAIASCAAYLAGSVAPSAMRWARGLYIASVAAIGYSCLYMLQQILSGRRYDIAYIHAYSAAADPILYKVSSLWAGQEGSMMLWALVAGLIGLVLARGQRALAPVAMAFWCSVSVFFGAVLVAADPFRKLSDFQPGMPGHGLDALLKNPWMVIYPPVVFLGYAALLVPAAFAAQALVDGDGKAWIQKCLPWALFGWVSLTAGLALGMIWSYEVLGWGGYWGWDPVENASLVPWLASAALLHGLLLQRYRGKMACSNLVLAFATFILVIYAAYLTRSGVLANMSVHSFADLGAHGRLSWGLGLFAAFSVGILIARSRAISLENVGSHARPKDVVALMGVIVLVLFALMVLAGTSLPLVQALFDMRPTSLDPRFYTIMSVPLAVSIAALISFASILNWGAGKSNAARRLIYTLAAVAVLAVPASMLAGKPPAVGILTSAALVALAASVVKCRGRAPLKAGAHVAHAGVAIAILGIVFSCGGRTTTISLVRNGPAKDAAGCSFAYMGARAAGLNTAAVALDASEDGHNFSVPLDAQVHGGGDSARAVYSPFDNGRSVRIPKGRRLDGDHAKRFPAPRRLVLLSNADPRFRLGRGCRGYASGDAHGKAALFRAGKGPGRFYGGRR